MFGRKLRKLLTDQAIDTKHRLDHIDHEIKSLKFQIISFSVQLNEVKSMLSTLYPGIDMKVEHVKTAKAPKKK